MLKLGKERRTEKYHVKSIGLSGSIVREDFKQDNNIDILVDFNQPIGIEFTDLSNELEALPNRKNTPK